MLTLEKYHSLESNNNYMSVSQYKSFVGSAGLLGCEDRAMAMLRGDYIFESTPAMKIGSYVDAHFSGTLDIFKAKNSDIFKKNGELLKTYEHANYVIERIERDPFFMMYMAGETQKITTAYILGCEWKIAIDVYHKGKAIVDLKVMKSIRDAFWVKDLGYTSFVTFYGYDTQGAMYQKVIEETTGEKLPFFIAGASKEKEPDIEIIGIDDRTLRNAYIEVEGNIERILAIKNGNEKPDRCNKCDWCARTKILTAPVHFTELNDKI